MQTRKYIYTVLILLTFFQGVLHSQEMMDTIIHIREVRVQATRPIKEDASVVSNIDSANISSQLTSNLGQLLGGNSIVHIRSYGYAGLSTVSFRGTAPSHTKLYWNDMEINDPATGQADLSLIPVGFVDELQLFHGSTALQQGGEALGGLIRIDSKANWNDGFNTRLVQSIGSFNTLYTYAAISMGRRESMAKLRIFRESSDNDFPYINSQQGTWQRERLKDASSLKNGYMAEYYRKFDDKDVLSLHNWVQFSDRDLPSIMSYMGRPRRENQEDATLRIAARWRHYGTLLNSKLSAGFSTNGLNYMLEEKDSGQKIYNTTSRSGNLFLKHEAETKFSRRTVIRSLVNLDYASANYRDLNSGSGFLATRPGAGITLSVYKNFDIPLTTYLLLREELVGNRWSPLIPSAGVYFVPGSMKNLSLRANFSRNYHFPGLNDLYWIPGGNPGLEPEEGYMADLSARYNWSTDRFKLKTSLTAFYSGINNWILWKPGEYGFWRAENLEKVISRGTEYLLDASYERRNFLIRLQGTYAWTRAFNTIPPNEYEGTGHEQLIYLPENKANANILVKWGRAKLNYRLFTSGKQFTTTDNDDFYALAAYSLHDLKLSGEFLVYKKALEMGFAVNNLFNENYQVIRSRPMPGRNFVAEIKIDL